MLPVVAYTLWRCCCSQGNEKYPAFGPWVGRVGVMAPSACSTLRKRRGRDVRKLRGMPDGSLGRTLTHAHSKCIKQLPKATKINHFAAKAWTESGVSARG